MRAAIVTDSTADIPGDLVEALGIHVVRNWLVIEGQSIEDGKGLSREEFYTRLPDMRTLPTTATASSGTYQELYGKLLQDEQVQVVSIHPAHQLSGILNAASTAAQAFPGRVHVVDSQTVTMSLGFQVMRVAEAALQGAEPVAILEMLQCMRPRARLIAMLDTVEYLRRSGRVGWARARMGDWLQLKPFIELAGGVVHNRGMARTRRKGIERLKEMLLALGTLERLAAMHTNAEAEARQVLEELDLNLPAPPLVVNATTVIGTHVGPGALGFAALVR